ncbi:putative transcriptional regulator, LysR family protein [Mycobacterium paraintracellulare]|uniref:Transcriptional regulator, LysR family protein n=2 Tax=Mycobacterium avium complex (MAC) TaxID=120793 RepID=A0ABN6ALX8_9MYCO|nr:LysR family transcriptional regulator [Mycobacterium paraintracellulare]BBY68609.1 putative transcriptional regulator, LysR family protein [Mycobacterium paraintracellulare]BCO43209.1 putative transcriptional regulator, LysR family protein [Mycobacterium paraintracellulare]
MSGMELRQLEYFIAVASEMNFSRAAQRVHVVQSALSTSVSKLEKELGVELFDRSKQQIKMTPAGELFREHARRVIHTARLAKDSIDDYRGELSGTVEIGSLISFGPLDVPKILGDFHRTYPFVRIILRLSPTGSMPHVSAIADGSLDLAFVSAPDRFPAGVEMRLLCEEPMLFVCRPDHRLAQRKHIAIAELAHEDLIGFPAEFGLRRVVENAFRAAGVTPRTPYEAAVNYWMAAGLVQHGLGTIFMPASDAGRFPDLRAVPLQPEIVWPIFLATGGQAQIAPAAAKLAEMLLAAAPRPRRRSKDK